MSACTRNPSQLALAWVLDQGSDVVPIPGTRRRSYLAENISALDIRLTPDDLGAIEEAAPRGAALGDRYPPYMMPTINH